MIQNRELQMKKISIAIFFSLLISISGCATLASIGKTKITVSTAVTYKDRIDNATNPARKRVLLEEVQKRRVEIPTVLVKKIDTSSNIDYDFEVVVEMNTNKGPVECYIYSQDYQTISELSAERSRIQVEGDFSRFFTMLDDYYTKIEITNATITKLN
jgi:hypothetical protein